ncbi:HD domain-containing protein [Pendulispora brunnea]|uniref:HD domain-containing protein n=1 Tax=Pendulispora brunnea TaxID=2905690 RepID=A0ABZ2JVF4_9BACT
MSSSIAGISIPDSKLARAATELVRDCATPLLFHHSSRVYYFGALTGVGQRRAFDPELLYVGAMFHDLGLTKKYASANDRFEVDGANAAASFLRSHGIGQEAIDVVWDAIALHTTPGIPEHKKSEVALVLAGVEMDVVGLGFSNVPEDARAQVVQAHPRGASFKQDIIGAFYEGIRHKPDTTFGNIKADVLARMDPQFVRRDFCDIILNSAWPS